MAFIEFRDVRKIYQMGEVEVAAVEHNDHPASAETIEW